MTSYRQAVVDAMLALAEDPRVVFVGQTVVDGGSQLGATLDHIPTNRKIEFPVCENTQLGFCTGLALAGWLPVCVFPRINFLIEALPQLVQHLDKLSEFGNGFNPRVIIRTAVASPTPLDPGPQHLGEFWALEDLLDNVKVVRLRLADLIVRDYRAAAEFNAGSTILIECLEKYDG